MTALIEILQFEVGYRLRRLSTWIYGALLALLPFVLLHAISGGTGWMNSPNDVATTSSLTGMIGIIITAALFGDAATRDVQTGMDPLVYSTPVPAGSYLGGRYLGALVVNAVLLLAVPLGQILAAAMPYMDPQKFGPFRLDAYVQAYVVFLLPNLLLSSAILFSIAALKRQMLPAFLGGIGLFILYVVANIVRANITSPALRILADPFGLLVLEDHTQFWTPVQWNTEAIGFPGPLIFNRLLALALAAVVLLALLRRFRFAHRSSVPQRRRLPITGPRAVPAPSIALPIAPRAFDARARMHQVIAVLRRSLEDIAANRAFLMLLAGAVTLTFLVGWNIGAQRFGTATWPVTHLLASTVVGSAVSPVIVILIAVFAGELVWKERELRMSAISDAAPVPDWVLLLGRFLALATMLVALLVTLTLSAIVLQAIQGWPNFEPGVYLRILFGIRLADFLLMAALAMVIHVVVNQKYVAHLLVVIIYVFTMMAPQLGIHHRLLIYGVGPEWLYSDMSGFGPFVTPILWFRMYWAAWALLLAVVARVLWVRGRDREVRGTLALARSRLTPAVLRAGGAAALLIVVLGGFIFYNTNILNDYRTRHEHEALQAKYEDRYKRFEGAPQPRILQADLRIELYPAAPAADIRGTFTLLNDQPRAIDSLHISSSPDVDVRSLRFDRPAQRVLHDAAMNFDIYRLDQPLQPGESVRLYFDLRYRTRGFRNGGQPTAIVGNGSHFDRSWFPHVGYRASRELADADARRDHGLPQRAATPSPYDTAAARRASGMMRGVEPVAVNVVVGTDSTQTVVTTGTLVRKWRENGRQYFHYRTDGPQPFATPFFSSRYAVRESSWGSVPLRVYYHPTHGVNVQRMLRSMHASLGYYSREFGPYQFQDLSIVEASLYHDATRAHPGLIEFGEGGAFLTRVDSGDVDRTFFVVAHETAHQWWGGQVRGADMLGSKFVSEMLAQYSAMIVMEKALGPEQLRRFYDYEMNEYLTGRTSFSTREAPLLEVDGQRHVYYGKGAVAMYTLREHIGEERVNLALRRFLAKFGGAGHPPFPTSLDLYREFQAVTPDSTRELLHDLFAEITLWDVKADSATMQALPDGSYRVALDVTARKLRADSIGRETEVAMNDLVEIAVFGAGADPIYLERHRIGGGRQRINIVVPQRPERAGVDPSGMLIQRQRSDNVVDVRGSAPAGQ